MTQISLLVNSVLLIVVVFGFLIVGIFLFSGGLNLGSSLFGSGMMVLVTGAQSASDSANAEKREQSTHNEVIEAFKQRLQTGAGSNIVAYSLSDSADGVVERVNKMLITRFKEKRRASTAGLEGVDVMKVEAD